MIEATELLEKILEEMDGVYLTKDREYSDHVLYDLEVTYEWYKLVLNSKSLEVSISTVWQESSESYSEPGDELDSFDFHNEEDVVRFKSFMETL